MTDPIPRAPWLARLILRIVFRRPGETTIWGDIEEGFTRRASEQGLRAARRWYWRQTVGSIGARARARIWRPRPSLDRGTGRPSASVGRWFESSGHDVRFAGRSLRRSPGFTVVAVLTIGLGIGGTTMMYSLVNGILLAPLAYPDPDRLVVVGPDRWYSKPFFLALRDATRSFEAVAGWAPRSHTVIDDDGARRVWGPRVTAGFFDVLGRTVAVGRTFADDEDRGPGDVVVISAGYWQRRFGRDPAVGSESIHLADLDRSVIGVMAPGFDLLQPNADVAVLQRMTSDAPGWGARELMLIGRLHPGVTLEQANADLSAFIASWREQEGLSPDWEADFGLEPLRHHLVGDVRPTLLMLFGAVGILLLIAIANVASLLVARALSRQREFALRLALGARPRRLFRQLLTEGTVLSVLGALLGVLVARGGIGSVTAMLPAETPRLTEVQIDSAALVFALSTALVTGWTIGVATALRSLRVDLHSWLQGGNRGGTESNTGNRIRVALVTLEVALVVTLLAGSGLLVKSFWQLSRVDVGFRAEGLVTFGISPPAATVTSHAQGQQFYALIEQRLAGISGVTSQASTVTAPLVSDGWIVGLYPEDRPPGPDEDPARGRWRAVSPAFFSTAGIPLVAGRLLREDDDMQHPQVGLLSQSAARRLFGNDDPIGRTVVVTTTDRHAVTVVGVVGDVKAVTVDGESPAIVYRPFAQIEAAVERFGIRYRDILLRTDLDVAVIAPLVRAAVRSVHPNAQVLDLRPMPAVVSDSTMRYRVRMILLSVFTAAALVLGTVGVYGVITYLVRERTRDLAIRMALGASGASVRLTVVRYALLIAGIGTAGGWLATVTLAGVLERFVFGITATDTTVLALAGLAALTVAAVAAFLPARRASRIDVTAALTDSP